MSSSNDDDTSEDTSALSAPQANAYEAQSGGVIAMLEKLLEKFEDELAVIEKEEMEAKGSFQKLEQQLTDNIRHNKHDVKQKVAFKAQRKGDAATAKGDKKTAESALTDDEGTLTDTDSECHSKSEEFEKNQVLRAEEVEAIQKAVDILGSDDVKGNAGKHLPSSALIQKKHKKGSALAQLRTTNIDSAHVRHRVADFLDARAQKLGSRYLALIASRAEEDPFAKVKKMIKDMITKLMEEANAEADSKGYCDKEMATNMQTRETKAAEVDELTAGVEEKTALVSKLAEQVSQLTESVAETKEAQASATAFREEEKAINTQTIKEAQAAQAAVERATQVLKDFYAKAAEAGSLVQEPYTGMQSATGGVMGFLEVILSDFANLETETSSAEDQAQSQYEKFMAESQEDAELKGAEAKHKENKRQQTEIDNRALKKELEMTQEELDKALDYYEKLKPDCTDTGMSYEDKVQQRKEEIVSLQEALKILSGDEV